MSHIDRLTGLWTRYLSTRTLDARIRFLPRAAAVVVVLTLGTAFALQLAASRQLDAARSAYPGIDDARALTATLSALRAESAAGFRAEGQERRVDSLSTHFHSVARAGHGDAMASVDARFGDYMVQAHRAALGMSSSTGDASVSSAVEAEQTARVLAAQLAAAERSAAHDVSLGLESAASLQSTMSLLLAGAGILSMLALLALGTAARRSVTDWVDGMTDMVNALVDGDLSIMIRDSADGPAGRMHTALRRLARQLRDNADTAHALASGAYRRAARNVAPRDPVGLGLALIATSMSEIAGASERMARGDLTVVVTPKSADDSFGHAHAAMARRVIGTLRDVEATRGSIAAMADAMRGDVAALASSATTDNDRLRRTHERLSLVTMQAGADAARGVERARRVAESESMLVSGNAALQSSLDDVGELLRGSTRVQQLARDAARLAVDAGISSRTGGDVSAVSSQQEAARTLATDAADMSGSLTRLMIDGTEHVNAAGVAFDRVSLVVQDQLAVARELDAATRRHSDDLHEIDATVVHVQRTTSNSAETARQLVIRLDALASQTRRLDAVLRRFEKGRSPVIRSAGNAVTAAPVLYNTPPHTHLAFSQLGVLGN